MSKRRSVGEIVWKKENAGFVGVAGLFKIQDQGSDFCMIGCGDPDCLEWNTCWEVDEAGNPLGCPACHWASPMGTTANHH